MTKSKSVNRESVKILKDIGWSIVKSIPIAGAHIESAEKVFSLFNAYQKASCQERFESYILGIEKIADDEVEISREHFVSLVRKMMLDDEDRKSEYYARLTVGLAKSNLNDEERHFHIKALSDLTCFDIDYARRLYIATNTPIKGFKTSALAQASITSQKKALSLRSLNKLISSGLVYEDRTGEVKTSPGYKLTNDLERFLKFIFHNDDLQPTALSIESKDEYDVIIIDSDKIYRGSYPNIIYHKLRDAGVKVCIEKSEDCIAHKRAKFFITAKQGSGLNGFGDWINYGDINVLTHLDNNINSFYDNAFRETVDYEHFSPIDDDPSFDASKLNAALNKVAAFVLGRLSLST
ncbi:hypothetical protein HVX40_24165 (plasmid) [Escherichia coli]|nr:hypothetical protein [Escherichia coli]